MFLCDLAPSRPDDNIIRSMRVACWITEATDTHAEYVILIAYACIACLLVFCHLPQLFITFVSFSLCIVNDHNLFVPTNAQFLLE